MASSAASSLQPIALERPQALAHSALRPGVTIALPWGRGGGKSWFQRLCWYLLIAHWDGRLRPGATETGVRIVLLMPYLEQAKKVHAQKMLDEVEGIWKFLGGKVNRTDWRVTFPGGSWIQWVSAERADAARGIRCDVVSVDECDDVDPEVYDAICRPWFTEPHSLRIRILSGTPRRGTHGLLYRTHARAEGLTLDNDGHRFTDHASFHASCYDFPINVSPAEVEKVRLETAAEMFKREYLCDFLAAEGLVYSDFDARFHVKEPDPAQVWSEILIGGDHGYEDPGVLLAIGIAGHGQDATAHVLAEVYARHQDPDWWTAQVRNWVDAYPGARWYLDPSRPDLIRSYQKVGARIAEVDNSIEDGVGVVQNLLKVREAPNLTARARLYVSRHCPNLIREFGQYRRKRDPRNRETVLETIEGKNDHAMDALRYPLFARFRTTASTSRRYRET